MYHREEPIWDAKTMNRKRCTSNMVTCGWCQYRSAGTQRYDCMLRGRCSLGREYDDECFWDTLCRIVGLGKKDIESLIEDKYRRRKGYEQNILSIEQEIIYLSDIMSKAEDSPPSPRSRKSEHFNVGDRVVVFEKKEKQWKFATVVYGYRHHDGCVSFVYDGTPAPKYEKLDNPLKGTKYEKDGQDNVDAIGDIAKAPGCGMSIPHVMLLSEFEYFIAHPETFIRWITNACEHIYNGEKVNPQDFPTPKGYMLTEQKE